MDSVLKPGGVLATGNTSYLFGSSSVAHRYGIIRSDRFLHFRGVNVFCRDGRPMIKRRSTRGRMLVQIDDHSEFRDEFAMTDRLFVKHEAATDSIIDLPGEFDATRYQVAESWTASDFDGLSSDVTTGCLEFWRVHQIVRDIESGRSGFVTTHRRARIFGEGFISGAPTVDLI